MAQFTLPPDGHVAALSAALKPVSDRLSDWGQGRPIEEVVLAPGVAEFSPLIWDALDRYTGNRYGTAFIHAVRSGEDRALYALGHIVEEIRRVMPVLVSICMDWLKEGNFDAVIWHGQLISSLAARFGDDDHAALAAGVLADGYWNYYRSTGRTTVTLNLELDDGSGRTCQVEEADIVAASATLYQRAIAKAANHPDLRAFLAGWHNSLGLAFSRIQRTDEAVSHFRIAVQRETQPQMRLESRANLAAAFLELGEYRLAELGYESICTELDIPEADRLELVGALHDWAAALTHNGKPAQAVPLLERAATMLRQQEIDQRCQIARSLIGAYRLAGRQEDAAQALRDCWDLCWERACQVDVEHFRDGFRAALLCVVVSVDGAWSYLDAARRAHASGQWEAALWMYDMAARIFHDGGYQSYYLRCRAGIAETLLSLQQVDAASLECRRVQEAAFSTGLAAPLAIASATMAELLLAGSDEGDSLDALASAAQALVYSELRDRLADEFGLPAEHPERWWSVTGGAKTVVAAVAMENSAYDLAEQHYRDAVALARRFGNRSSERIRKLGLLTALYAQQERATEAEDLARELRNELAAPDIAPAHRLAIYRSLGTRTTDSTQSLADLHAAAELMEVIRAQRGPGTERSDLDREYSIYPRLLWRQHRMAAPPDEAFVTLQAMRARRLMETLTAASGDTEPYRPITMEEIQERLASQPRPTTFVDVAVTETGLRAYLVDQDGLRTVDVAGDTEPLGRGQWDDLLSAPKSRPRIQWAGDVRERAADVIRFVRNSPMLAELASAITDQLPGDSTALLAVDDVLSNLPLHAIPVDQASWGDLVSVSRIPAAGVLRFARSDRRWTCRAVVAGDSNNDLPGAQRECRAVADMLDTEPILGDACTIDAVRDALTSSPDIRLDVVHLAVHGRADPQRGGRSSLLFAGAAPTWVPFADLVGLPWRANLIVFAGCSTAVGGPRHGQGLYGVAQAAAEAGATTVIASLWPVDDTSAATFMTAFYNDLIRRRGQGVIDLREPVDYARNKLRQTLAHDSHLPTPRDGRELFVDGADLEMPLRDAELAAMMQWAPFVLIGEPTLVV